MGADKEEMDQASAFEGGVNRKADDIKILDGEGQPRSLVDAPSEKVGVGLSEKSFRQDDMHAKYIVKNPKSRTLGEIFGGAVYDKELAALIQKYKGVRFETSDSIKDESDRKALKPYIKHLQDLLVESALGEIIFSTVSGTLFPDSLASPETYLHIDSKTGVPQVLSKLLDGFNEFLDEKVQDLVPSEGPKPTSPDYWTNRKLPSREELGLSKQEDYLLGKLFAVALLCDDWDLLNNISLANAGCIGETAQARKIAIVDGGNKFHFGFGGLTKSETALKNPEISSPENLEAKYNIKGFVAALPFEEAVYPHLPRQLVSGLFDLENPEVYAGFKDAVKEALASLTKNPECIQEAIDSVFQRISLNSAKEIVAALQDHAPNNKQVNINHSYYFPPNPAELESKGELTSKPYTLNSMLRGRLASLQEIIRDIDAQKNPEVIAQEVFALYMDSQRWEKAAVVPASPTPGSSSGTLFADSTAKASSLAGAVQKGNQDDNTPGNTPSGSLGG